MQVAQGPDRLAISRVNFRITLAKAEKCRTHAMLSWRNSFSTDEQIQYHVAYAAEVKYTVGECEKSTSAGCFMSNFHCATTLELNL